MRDKKDITVLVLGVGGNVSQGILKALERSTLSAEVIAADPSPEAVGLYFADQAYVCPWAQDGEFEPWVEQTCAHHGVHAVLSGVEEVLEALSPMAARLRQRTGAVLIASPPEVLEIGADKLATCRWLRDHGLPHPRFADLRNPDAVAKLRIECGLPLIAKPRRGKSARGVILLASDDEVARAAGTAGMVVQEHLGDKNHEYTAGCLCDADRRLLGTIVMRRELQNGTTYRAQAGAFPRIREVAERVIGALGAIGPCNAQLRLRDGEPVPFELNVRFSGTTPLRARLGFNEVEAALRHLALGEPPARLPEVERGLVVRYWNEVYVAEEATATLEATGQLADSRHEDGTIVEDWGMGR